MLDDDGDTFGLLPSVSTDYIGGKVEDATKTWRVKKRNTIRESRETTPSDESREDRDVER